MVITEVASLKKGEWLIERWPVKWRGNGHVKEVASLMEGEWFCYKGCLFNGGGMVMLERWAV